MNNPSNPSSANAPYQLMVMTRPANIGNRTLGHAMIAIGNNRCTGIQKSCCLEAWGLYPDGIRNELLQNNLHLYTRSIVIPISGLEYRKIRKAVEDWRLNGPDWTIAYMDCTDFVQKLLASIGIKVKDYLWPDNFGKSLESHFGSQWGHCRP